jgi:hypothetical protein
MEARDQNPRRKSLEQAFPQTSVDLMDRGIITVHDLRQSHCKLCIVNCTLYDPWYGTALHSHHAHAQAQARHEG